MILNISFMHFLASLVFITLGLIIFIRDPRQALNRVCAIVFICFFIWSFSYTFIQNPFVSQKTANLFEKIGSIGWIFYAPNLLWFALIYGRKKRLSSSPVFLIALFIPAFIFCFKQWADQSLIQKYIQLPYGWLGLWQTTSWPYLFFVYYFLTSSASLLIIWKHGKKSNDVRMYRQSMVLVISALVSFIGGTLSNVVFVKLHLYVLPPMGDVIILSWAGSMTFAILRYKLLSISPVIAAEEIISSMKDLLFLLNPQAKIISFNNAALNSLSYEQVELEGRSIIDLFGGPDQDKKDILFTIQHSSKGEFETSLITKGGALLPVGLSTSVLPGIGIVCVAHDVSVQRLRTELLLEKKIELESEISKATKELQETNARLRSEIAERKQAVDALEESEERLRILFEFAPDGIYLNDHSGNFIDGNREAERITGYSKSELIGQNFLSLNLLSSQQIFKAGQIHQKNVPDIPAGPVEFILNRKDGTQSLVEISTYSIKVKERKLVLGIARDISQRKKNEEEKKLLKEELYHAQKMEAIGRLAGGIAHDFNNLLCCIIGYADLLHRKLETFYPQEVKTVSKIIETAKQASDLTSSLLAFARKGKYQVEAINLHNIVEEVVDLLKTTIDKSIILSTRLDALAPMVMGDKSQLLNALLNLAVNSRDAMPNGGLISFESDDIEINETLARTNSYAVKPGTYVKLSIGDNGIGMDTATKAHIFEPFFTTKKLGKGTGLGLASVYGTMKSHNGSIELVSESGKGTTFVLFFPKANVACDNIPIIKSKNIQKRSGRILIVEDENTLREMASEAIISFGYLVHSCENGSEAVEYYRVFYKEIDLVLLDLTMPGLSGSDTFKALKDINPEIRAIITSGHALDDEIGILLQKGAGFFLKKPYNLQELSDALSSTQH